MLAVGYCWSLITLIRVLSTVTRVAVLLISSIGHAATPAVICMDRAGASLDALVRADYAGARKDFNASVSDALDASRLESAWTQIQSQAGAYRKHAPPRSRSVSSHDVVVTSATFATTTLDVVVACDDSGKISAVRFVLPSAADVGAVPPRERRCRHRWRARPALGGDYTAASFTGVLTLPAGKGPFPVVLMMAGSGPQDRDVTIGPNKPFSDIARGVADLGIATLRYDKRT